MTPDVLLLSKIHWEVRNEERVGCVTTTTILMPNLTAIPNLITGLLPSGNHVNKQHMKIIKYHTVGTPLKSNNKIVERDQINTHSTQVHDRSLSCLGTSISIKSGGLNKFYRVKPPLLVKWCGHARIFHMWVKCQPLHVAGDFLNATRYLENRQFFNRIAGNIL